MCSTPVWQITGNEYIWHLVGTAACPSTAQQILALGRVEGSRTVRCMEAATLSYWTSGHDWLDLRQVYRCVCIISRSLLWRFGFDFTAGRMKYCCFFSQPLRCLGISVAFDRTVYGDDIILTFILLKWRIGRDPNSNTIYSYIQQEATSYSLFISGNCSTRFGWYFHPSSGTHTTVSFSIWYLSHRYCYLPLSWKSWNRFECAVGGVRQAINL
jgi:hypothetical protein